MFASNTIPVIIVGAGPTGLAAGNLLGMAGVPTLIIERNMAVSATPKAIALDDEGMRVCQAMGLSRAMSSCILSDLSVECVSGERLLAKVVPRSRRNGHPLIATFYQPEFEAVLLDGLRRFSCVEARFQHEVETLEQSAESITVSIRTPEGALQQVQCAYLLACDGGKSSVRNALNIALQGTTFEQRWLVIDAFVGRGRRTPARGLGKGRRTPARGPATSTLPPLSLQVAGRGGCVTIFCDPGGRPAVAIPGPNRYRRWEFMLLPGETEKEMLEPATVSALLEQYAPQSRGGDAVHRVLVTGRAGIPGRDESRPYGSFQSPHGSFQRPYGGGEMQIVRKAVYTFHAARARDFSRGRAFLLGDAAHMMPPFGGQGLNSGLRDAHNLAWKVAMVLQNRAAPQLLATYHEERAGHAARMVAFASLLGNLFMSKSRPLVYCRNLLIRMLYALPIARTYLMELRIKPQARYRAGFFIGEVAGKSLGNSSREGGWRVFKWRKKSMVGSLLPQPEVITQEGQRVLLDEVLGTGFAVLRRYPRPEEAFASVETGFWENLGAHFVCIQTDEAPKKSGIKQYSRQANAPHEDAESHLSRALPVVVVRSMDKDFLSKCRDRFVVVRPDRFILGTFKEDRANAFEAAFQRLLYRGLATGRGAK